MLESAELRRRAYLHALGIDQYVSRADPPGAAPAVRLALRPVAPVAAQPAPVAPASGRPPSRPHEAAALADVARQATRHPAPDATVEPALTGAAAVVSQSERFSVAAIRAGGWLWLEDLGAMPLATEQVHLVKAMATALSGAVARSEVAQFDWPMHRNTQLDLGPEAAAASLGSFVQRQLEDGSCAGLVLLGESVSERISAAALEVPRLVRTRSTREVLEQPALKRQVWRDLKPHARA